MQFSRAVSPSPSIGGSGSIMCAPSIDLENLEELQERWSHTYETFRRGSQVPLPPQLSSPRSLRACEMCGVEPSVQLSKLSLRQHLNHVLGQHRPEVEAAAEVIMGPAAGAAGKIAMQEALYAFSRAGVGLGTAREKVVAYAAFRRQEDGRQARLAAAREVRRQLLAEETFERRRRQHVGGSSERSTGSGSHKGSRRGSNVTSVCGGGNQQTWSANVSMSSVPRAGRDQSYSGLSPPTAINSVSFSNQRTQQRATLGTTIATITAVNSSDVSGGGHASKLDCRSPMPVDETLPLPTTPSTTQISNNHESYHGYYSGCSRESSQQLAAFTPSPGRDGRLPYKPRDALALNTNFFGNRSLTSGVSADVAQQARPPAPYRPSPGSQNRSGRAGGDDSSVSIERRIGSVSRTDLSVVSIDSAHLDWVFNSSAAGSISSGVRCGPGGRKDPPGVDGGGVKSGDAASPAVMFHKGLVSVPVGDGRDSQSPNSSSVHQQQQQTGVRHKKRGASAHQASPSSTAPQVYVAPAISARKADAKPHVPHTTQNGGLKLALEAQPPPGADKAQAPPPPLPSPPKQQQQQQPSVQQHEQQPPMKDHALVLTRAEQDAGCFYYCANPAPILC